MVMSAPGDSAQSRSFRPGALRRRWVLVPICGLLGAAAALLASAALPVSYASIVSVVIEPTIGNALAPTNTGQSLANMNTEIAVATSTPVAQLVKRAVHTNLTANALRQKVKVTASPNSQVLQISYAAASPQQAQAIASAFGNAYLDYRKQTSADSTKSVLANIQTAMTQTRSQIDQAVRQLTAASPATQAYAVAARQVQSASSTLSALQSQADQIRFSQSAPGRVLSPATLPSRPKGIPHRLWPFVGLLLGLLIGIGLAWWRALRDPRAYDVEDLTGLEAPVLGSFTSRQRRPPVLDPRRAAVVAAGLRRRLGPDHQAVLVTGMGPNPYRVGAALSLVDALRGSALDAALVDVSYSVSESRDERENEASSRTRERHRGGGGTAQDEHGVPVYRPQDAARLDRAGFRDLLAEVLAIHELAVVVSPDLDDFATLDVLETVPDTVLVVPVGRYDLEAVASAMSDVARFHGNVIALLTEPRLSRSRRSSAPDRQKRAAQPVAASE